MEKDLWKRTYGEKRFLNNEGHHSVASIGYVLEVIYKQWEDDSYVRHDGTMWISDCSRVISLELDFGREDDYDNTKYKLTQLKEAATMALSDLERAQEAYVAAKATKEEADKQRKLERLIDDKLVDKYRPLDIIEE